MARTDKTDHWKRQTALAVRTGKAWARSERPVLDEAKAARRRDLRDQLIEAVKDPYGAHDIHTHDRDPYWD